MMLCERLCSMYILKDGCQEPLAAIFLAILCIS